MISLSLYHTLLMPIIQISHHSNRHPILAFHSTVVKIGEDDFIANIEEAEIQHWAKFDCIWSCTHCRDLPTDTKADTLDGVKKHISRM